MGRFEIYRSVDGGWRWRLRAANGRIIATGGKSYVRKEDAEVAIALVQVSGGAEVSVLDQGGDERDTPRDGIAALDKPKPDKDR